MNHFPNYPYQYPQGPPFGWYHPYYAQNPEYRPFFHSNIYGQPVPFFPPYESNKVAKTQAQLIKLEEESVSQKKQIDQSQKSERRRVVKNLKKKKTESKLLKGAQNIYIHPPKKVVHRVKYFDPAAAPVVTTASYNLVENWDNEVKRSEQIMGIPEEKVDELDFPEKYENPFILFKYRRIKKKFKKYVRPKDEQQFEQKCDESDSENVNEGQFSDEQNDSSEDQSETEKQKSPDGSGNRDDNAKIKPTSQHLKIPLRVPPLLN